MYDPQETTWGASPESETKPSPRRLPPDDSPPDRIGPCVVRDKLGEGGFGQVFLADQLEPVRRKVAIKIIKPGMASDGLIARFEQERQALAVMSHPGVAKVYDGGVTESGRPYFVMEFVDGQPLVRFADTQRMTVRERVELMVQVCEAVHHAHMKGVIHRDLKPGNILARMIDGKPRATVIDFGIAKALHKGQDGFSEDVVTEIGQVIGSRDYMSPEQAGSGPDDIDTRTDVYALGVVLYELITGVTPFDKNAMRSASFVELQRIIQMVDPAKPSTRFRDLQHSAIAQPDPRTHPETLAYNRRGDERAVARMLRGELDWICMKCLEKERHRRYDTAGALAEELSRFLSGEAVAAGPPSGFYKARKFVRRNKAGVAASAFTLLALVFATGTSTVFALSETRQRRLADQARDNVETVSDFQSDMLWRVNRTQMGNDVRDRLRREISERLAARGATQEQIDQLLAYFEGTIGLLDTASIAMGVVQDNMLADAAASIERRYGADPIIGATLRQTVGDTYLALGRYDDAQPQFETALNVRRASLGEGHPDTLETINSLGLVLEATGDLEGAQARYETALDGYRTVLGRRNHETLNVMANLASLLLAMGKPADAMPYAQEAAEGLGESIGSRHPDTLAALNNLGSVLAAAGQFSQADEALGEAIEGRRSVLGPTHQATLSSLHNRSVVRRGLGDYEGAFADADAAVSGRRAALGDKHPDTLASITNLGALFEATNRSEQALPLLAEASRGFLEAEGFGPDHASTISANSLLATNLFKLGRLEEAETLYRDVLRKRERLLATDHPETLGTMVSLGSLRRARGDFDEAVELQQDATRKLREALGPEHPDSLRGAFALGQSLEASGETEEAERVYSGTIEFAKTQGHPDLGEMLHRHGYVLGVLGRYADAAPVLEEANLVLVRTRGEAFGLTIENTATLAGLYERWAQEDPEGGHEKRAAEWRERLEANRQP